MKTLGGSRGVGEGSASSAAVEPMVSAASNARQVASYSSRAGSRAAMRGEVEVEFISRAVIGRGERTRHWLDRGIFLEGGRGGECCGGGHDLPPVLGSDGGSLARPSVLFRGDRRGVLLVMRRGARRSGAWLPVRRSQRRAGSRVGDELSLEHFAGLGVWGYHKRLSGGAFMTLRSQRGMTVRRRRRSAHRRSSEIGLPAWSACRTSLSIPFASLAVPFAATMATGGLTTVEASSSSSSSATTPSATFVRGGAAAVTSAGSTSTMPQRRLTARKLRCEDRMDIWR